MREERRGTVGLRLLPPLVMNKVMWSNCSQQRILLSPILSQQDLYVSTFPDTRVLPFWTGSKMMTMGKLTRASYNNGPWYAKTYSSVIN